jgi:uncharacterized RDD family membrane protein YckC
VSAHAPHCPECGADPRTGRSSYHRGDRDRVRVCAGVGIRAVALAIDVAVLSGVFLLIALVVYLLLVAAGEFAVVGREPEPWPLWVAFSTAAFFYFWIAEAAWGRTVGKRVCDLRVVRADGRPIGAGASFMRNVLRAVDFLPAFYVVATIVVWLTPRNQRVGDLAARTVVVRPRTVSLGAVEAARLPVVPWPGETSRPAGA